jgi:hypothetical protein
VSSVTVVVARSPFSLRQVSVDNRDRVSQSCWIRVLIVWILLRLGGGMETIKGCCWKC